MKQAQRHGFHVGYEVQGTFAAGIVVVNPFIPTFFLNESFKDLVGVTVIFALFHIGF